VQAPDVSGGRRALRQDRRREPPARLAAYAPAWRVMGLAAMACHL
jgi:hypothetical protein